MDRELEKLFDIQKEKARELRAIENRIKEEGHHNRELMNEYRTASSEAQKATREVIVELKSIHEKLGKGANF